MLILLYGSNGWIGTQLKELFKSKNINTISGTARCNDFGSLKNEIEQIKPTHVVATIGRTHGNGINTIDCLEDKDMLHTNIGDNMYSPICIASVCKELFIHFTYLGTGCIFNKDNETASYKYTESDDPDFFGSSYSVVKGYTDMLMRNMFNEVALNVRIRMPIVDDLRCNRNFVSKILEYPQICSIHNSMTYLPELLPILIDMLINYDTGTINLVNPGIISHNEILEMYKNKIDPSKTWENISIDQQNKILKSKRSNNWLCTKKLENNYQVNNIKTIINDIFEQTNSYPK